MPRHTDPVTHIYEQARRHRRITLNAQFDARLAALDDLAAEHGAQLLAEGKPDAATELLAGIAATKDTVERERATALARLDASAPNHTTTSADMTALAEAAGVIG